MSVTAIAALGSSETSQKSFTSTLSAKGLLSVTSCQKWTRAHIVLIWYVLTNWVNMNHLGPLLIPLALSGRPWQQVVTFLMHKYHVFVQSLSGVAPDGAGSWSLLVICSPTCFVKGSVSSHSTSTIATCCTHTKTFCCVWEPTSSWFIYLLCGMR